MLSSALWNPASEAVCPITDTHNKCFAPERHKALRGIVLIGLLNEIRMRHPFPY